MTVYKSHNDIRELAAHSGYKGPAIGETVWILEDKGTMWGVWPTRHDAIGARAKLANTNCYQEEWFNLIPLLVGAVRISDIRCKENLAYLGNND